MLNEELPSIFLTSKEVEEFTGYKRTLSQMQWLADHDYRFAMNSKGRVIVLRAYVENILGLNQNAKTKKQKIIEPNWDSLNKR